MQAIALALLACAWPLATQAQTETVAGQPGEIDGFDDRAFGRLDVLRARRLPRYAEDKSEEEHVDSP